MSKQSLVRDLELIRELAEKCIKELVNAREAKAAVKAAHAGTSGRIMEPDFGIPLRPFVKKYGKALSGPKKFVLLLAYLVKGDLKREVKLAEVEKHWNKMTAKELFGLEFNRFYSGQARDNDWVEATRQGSYHLRPDWKEILR